MLERSQPKPMVSVTEVDHHPSGRSRGKPPGPPQWTGWLQIGLSSLLAVLFLAMLGKVREQSTELRRLEQRVQGLENSRALDRTTVLEEQQRAMLRRLQSLESGNKRLEAIEQQQERWREALADMQNRTLRRLELPPQGPVAPPISSPGRIGSPGPGRPEAGVLRPPSSSAP
jgi:hypothetical protein